MKHLLILGFLLSLSFHTSAAPSSHESVADYKSRIKSRFKGEKLDIIFKSKSFKINGPNEVGAWYASSQARYNGVFGVGWKKAWSKNGVIKITVMMRKKGNQYLVDGPNVMDNKFVSLIKHKRKGLGTRIKDFFTGRKEKGTQLYFAGNPEKWYKSAIEKRPITIKLQKVETAKMLANGTLKSI